MKMTILAGFAPGRHELTFRSYRYSVLVEKIVQGVRMRFDKSFGSEGACPNLTFHVRLDGELFSRRNAA